MFTDVTGRDLSATWRGYDTNTWDYVGDNGPTPTRISGGPYPPLTGGITGAFTPVDIGGIPTPSDLLPGGKYSGLVGGIALAYGGINLLRGRRNFITLASLAYGLWATGILNALLPKDSSGKLDTVSLVTSMALPASAAGLMFGAGGMALNWLGKKAFSKPRRRTYRRTYYRRYRRRRRY